MKDMQQAFSYVEQSRSEIIELYRDFINHVDWSRRADTVKAFSDLLKTEMEKENFACKYVPVGGPCDEPRADMLVGMLGEDRPGKPVLFIGHMDTVFPPETFPENPFYIDDDGFAHGPGVLDMKGGILIALWTVKTLNRIGWAERPVKFVFAGDEEINHEGAQTAELMQPECAGAEVCFNMETGLIDNYLCIARKACLRYRLEIEGVETHSGNDFAGGRSSIVEMAHKIVKLHELNQNEFGNNINIGTIQGGTVPNAVPKHCEAVLDLRYNCKEGGDALVSGMEKICAETAIEGTSSKLTFLNKLDVYEATDDVMKLLAFVKDTAASYGLPEVNGRPLGGGSDSPRAQYAGVPTLDSCGVRGQWNHTTREYAVVESLFERIKMWTAVVANIENFAK